MFKTSLLGPSLLAGVILSLGASAVRADVSANLLTNSDFSQPFAIGQAPPDWALYGKHNAQSEVRQETRGGAPVLHILDRDAAGEVGISRTVPAIAGETYGLQAEVLAAAPESGVGAFLQLNFLPGNTHQQIGLDKATPVAPEAEWKTVTVTGTAPHGTTAIQIYLYSHMTPQPDFFVRNISLRSGIAPATAAPAAEVVPPPVPPQYTKLKDLHLPTALVQNGKAVSAIVAPAGDRYAADARALQKTISDATGVTVPVVDDKSAAAAVPFAQNLILLGNRSTNAAISTLYDRFYALTDLKYPGAGGYEVRSVHNPFGNGHNAILLGASDDAGVQGAVQSFQKNLVAQKMVGQSLSVGWLQDVKLAQPVQLPSEGAGRFPTWQDSKGYNSQGYFGWNSVSKNMALYYQTGDPKYAKEFLRLSFPDAAAKKEIDKIDEERIENKDDPLAGPYHYDATRMMLYWDLIEESPVFTDSERLKVTNALSRQLDHYYNGPDSSYIARGTYNLTAPGSIIYDRHVTYTALSMYVLSRYFARDYGDAVWKHLQRASGEYYFAPLAQPIPWATGEGDTLYWYNTILPPLMDYMILSGDRRGVQSGALAYLLRNQEVLWDGSKTDSNLSFTALDYLNKAAYLTGDGRWITYRQRLALDTEPFRLDQSFWPDGTMTARAPDDLLNRWSFWWLPPPQIAARGAGFTPQESFANMSFRTALDETGDFILLDGMDGGGRNPNHTFALLDLRFGGRTLLSGYLNQVRTSADGTVEPKVARDAALKAHFVLGNSVLATAEVPNLPYCGWTRTWYFRTGRYALAVDRLKFHTDSQRFLAEFWWQNEKEPWTQKDGVFNAGPTQMVNADSLYTELEGKQLKQLWESAVKPGEEKFFFSLAAPGNAEQPLRGDRVAPNAALFATPETTLVSVGSYQDVNAALAVRTATSFFANTLTSAPGMKASAPVDVVWDYAEKRLNVIAAKNTQLTFTGALANGLQLDSKKIDTDGKQTTLSLSSGTHVVTGVLPSVELKDVAASDKVLSGKATKPVAQKPTSDVPAGLPMMAQSATATLPEAIRQSIVVNENDGPRSFVAAGKIVYQLDAQGKTVRQFAAPEEVRALHWWPEARLMVIGTKDQKVLAYGEDGALKWTFQSEMAPEVYAAGKTYWFNTWGGMEGIHGLGSGVFLDNRSQLFVGGASTLEILDENGKLIKRMPQFWGPPVLFRLIPGEVGSINLLTANSITGFPAPHIVNNKTLDPAPTGFMSVPDGYDVPSNWMSQRDLHLFHADVDGDGNKEVIADITGSWNRISVWDEKGKPKANVSFGPGPAPYAGWPAKVVPALIRDTDIADVDGDGKPEIVTALSSGLVIVLDGQCRVKWSKRLNGVPTALEIVNSTIVVGQEDGTVPQLNGKGEFTAQAKVESSVSGILELKNGFIVTSGKSWQKFDLP